MNPIPKIKESAREKRVDPPSCVDGAPLYAFTEEELDTLIDTTATAILEHVREEVEGMKRNLPENERYGSAMGTYNQALTDTLTLLTSLQAEIDKKEV